MNFPETLDDLDDLVQEVERKGYRIRYLDPFSDNPVEYHYLPAPNKDGVKEAETPELMRKVETVSIIRKWTDLTIVGPDLEPLANTLKHTSNKVKTGATPVSINNNDLSVDEILATARTGVPRSELPRSIYSEFDNEDKFDRVSEQVAKAYQVPLSKLRRIAIAEDVDGVENVEAALVQIAESIKAGS